MASKTNHFQDLRTAIRNRSNLRPVYILHGEEGYFIDALVEEFAGLLPEDEREFNLNVLYAPRVDMSEVPAICSRIPMFSDFQVVIVKEAQAAKRALGVLVKYIGNPSPTTILVVASRGEKLSGEIMTAAKKNDNVVIFESKTLYDSDMPPYISEFVKERGLSINREGLNMLTEYIGADLSKLYNEIGKLTEILGKGAMITPEAIEKHIGMSRAFNSYELVDALAAKDAARVFRIADYFRSNRGAAPLVVVTGNIFSYFSDLLTTYFAKDRSDRALMAMLGIKWDIQFRRYANGRRNYNAFQVIEIIRAIRAFASQSKGNGSRRDEYDLFHELLYRILTAGGELFPAF